MKLSKCRPAEVWGKCSPAAAQAGLVHFTRSISGKLAKLGVRLCCLCPQPVDTPMVSNMQSLGLPMPETGASLLTPQRVRQMGAPPRMRPQFCSIFYFVSSFFYILSMREPGGECWLPV